MSKGAELCYADADFLGRLPKLVLRLDCAERQRSQRAGRRQQRRIDRLPGDYGFRHRGGHSVDAARSAARRARCGRFDRGQATINALDRGVGLVGINGDDQLEFAVSHDASPRLE